MSVTAQIEIAASPEDVRRIFLDFPSWPKIGDSVLRSVTALPTNDPSIRPGEKGSKVAVDFGGMKTSVLDILENNQTEFSWYGNLFYLFAGTHTFSFLPSEVTKGHTTFVNTEVFAKAFWVAWKLGMDSGPVFTKFCESLKERVEGVLEEERTGVVGGQ